MRTDEAPARALRDESPCSKPVLEAREVSRHYPVRHAGRDGLLGKRLVVHAVDDVSLALHPGRITAVVGESGSGKSTIARVLARLESPTKGELLLSGAPVGKARGAAFREYLRRVQMIFQDPFASLNPIHTVEHHLARPLQLHGPKRGKAELHTEVLALLERVSLTPAEQFARKRPHELSGGQRQRVSIARALAVRPEVLLADEPVSMLDVSIRLGVLNLLQRLGHEDGLALLYITHDIASARYFADDVQVMYAGRLVEGGPAEAVTQRPAHPYTRLLIDSAPDPDRRGALTGERAERLGEAPDLADPPSGCRFHPRCPLAMPVCKEQAPPKFPVPAADPAPAAVGTAATPPGATAADPDTPAGSGGDGADRPGGSGGTPSPGAADHWAACWLHAPDQRDRQDQHPMTTGRR